MADTSSGMPACYVCSAPTSRVVSASKPFPGPPANPRDIVPICLGCGPSWDFALRAPAFSLAEANRIRIRRRKRGR